MSRLLSMRQAMALALVAACTLFVTAQAHSADYPPLPLPAPPAVQKAPVLVEEFGSGWYLRADIGYRMNDVGSANAVATPFPTNAEYDDGYVIGAGAGFKWSWFRTDLTLDYTSRARYTANGTGTSTFYNTQLETGTALGNVYFDLGTWWGFTPYIGAGAGASYLKFVDFNAGGTAFVTEKEDKVNFAWAAMAGVSYAVSSNVLVDVGYRYLDLGDLETGRFSTASTLELKDITAHEIRVGLRYVIE